MSERIEKLVTAAEEGKFEDVQTLAAALREEQATPRIVELSRAPQAPLRGAAALAAAGSEDEAVLEVARRLATDADPWVRRMVALALTREPLWSVRDLHEAFLGDADPRVRRQGVKAALERPALHARIAEMLLADTSWEVRQEAADGLAGAAASLSLPGLLKALAADPDEDVQRSAAQSIERHLVELERFPDGVAVPRAKLLRDARERVRELPGDGFPQLSEWLAERVRCDVDEEELAKFGTLLTTPAALAELPRAYGVDAACEALMRVLRAPRARAAVLVGESGCGKTAVVHELAHRLAEDPDGPWHVVRVSSSDLLAGTAYLGEWQTRVQNLLAASSAPKRVVIYVPHLHELSAAGRTSKTDLNVATMLSPHIESGALAIIGEAAPEAFSGGLGGDASLRRLFTPVVLDSLDDVATREVLTAVRDEQGVDIADDVLDRLMELADFYLSGTAQPGRSVGLLRRVLETHEGELPPSTTDVLTTLSMSTGLPVHLLDDSHALDLEEVRAFFEARVMGQADAIRAVVDLVALIKAGLTDPGKPFGVFLFVGPTGVGKTELARALAEFLFGDPARLLRLDMSEYATWDGFERLIGRGDSPGRLTRPVRDQPFSVVLLDEIEKAHVNVFDLCLQVFDAGRLTDSGGKTIDFRRTIVVLTSNLGAADPTRRSVGFGGGDAPDDPERTDRELARAFRPEFLNRIDHIVRFVPLALQTAERIARREVSRVLERSGITRRELSVDVGPGVLALLLRQGYSPAFGARPLKRTVERLVLLPVAREIATGRIAPGSVLQLRAGGERVKVRIVPAETTGESTSGDDGGAVAASPVRQAAEELRQLVDDLSEDADGLARRKSALLEDSRADGFRADEADARERLDTIHRLEDVVRAYRRLRGDVAQLAGRSSRPAGRNAAASRARLEERLAELSQEYDRVRSLLSYRDIRELGDAIIVLSLVSSQGVGLSGVERLARMYQALAQRRGFECEVLDDRTGGEVFEDTIALLIGGGGAYGLLGGESGSHQLLRTRKERGSDRKLEDRDIVRIEVLPAPTEATRIAEDDLRTEVRGLRGESGRLLRAPIVEVSLLHQPTMTSVRVWSEREEREAKLAARMLLRARLGAPSSVPAGQEEVARRYVLGPSPLVRDRRSGRTTGNLERVLQGDLRLFLRRGGSGDARG